MHLLHFSASYQCWGDGESSWSAPLWTAAREEWKKEKQGDVILQWLSRIIHSISIIHRICWYSASTTIINMKPSSRTAISRHNIYILLYFVLSPSVLSARYTIPVAVETTGCSLHLHLSHNTSHRHVFRRKGFDILLISLIHIIRWYTYFNTELKMEILNQLSLFSSQYRCLIKRLGEACTANPVNQITGIYEQLFSSPMLVDS